MTCHGTQSFIRRPGVVHAARPSRLHWLIALLIVCGFALGWVMTDIPGFTPTKLRYFSWHKWIGVTVFALAVVRILWRATHGAPAMPRRMPAWQRGAAHPVHLLLYALMIAIPVSGYLYSSAANVPVVYLGLIPLPRLIAPDPHLKELLKNRPHRAELHVAGAGRDARARGAQASVAGPRRAAVAHDSLPRIRTTMKALVLSLHAGGVCRSLADRGRRRAGPGRQPRRVR